MRRLCALCVALLLLLTLTGCGSNVKSVVRQIDDPGKYTEEEINAAMDVAVARFDEWTVDCTLLTISYDGAARAKAEAHEAEVYGTDQVMILLSDFETGENSEAFSPNMVYSRWQWFLVKENDIWVLKNSGYG